MVAQQGTGQNPSSGSERELQDNVLKILEGINSDGKVDVGTGGSRQSMAGDVGSIGNFEVGAGFPNRPIETANLDAVLRLQFDQVAKKRLPSYGLRVMQEMWTYVNVGNSGYYSDRTARWLENELWAVGNKGGEEFYPMMGVEGNKTWINIDYKIAQIVTTYVKKVIQIHFDREEKPEVKATDIGSVRFKEREKIIAKYRMENAKKIAAMEAASGLKGLEQGFTPEDEDELDVYFKIEYRIPEESFMEDEIWKVFQNSGYDYLKRQLLFDLIVKNIGVTKKEKAPGTVSGGQAATLANRVRVRRCVPENTVYNIFRNADGSDVTLIGEAYPLKISDARRMFPNITEKEWWQISQVTQKGLTQAKPLDWVDTYVWDFNRPYDDYSFMVFDCEVKVYDEEWYVKGDWGIDEKKGVPKNVGPDKEVISRGKFNIYGGIWAINTDVILKWGVEENQLRPYQNGVDVFSNYSIVYPDANGWYVPSILERSIPAFRQAIGCLLKIQQMVSLMEPDNDEIDIAGLSEGLDIGTGGVLRPMDLLRLKKQTGVRFWDSTDASGTGGNGQGKSPYAHVQYSANVAQINSLIAVYNFWIGIGNQEWGVTPELMGQPTSSKKSATATRQASTSGGLSIEYIYDHYIMLIEQNATKVGYTLWDDMVFNASEYKRMSGEFGAGDGSIIDSTFDINVEMIDKKAAKENLMLMVEDALKANIIGMATAARLLDISNPKTAILYLEKLEKRHKKDMATMQHRQMQMNAQVQQQSAEITSEAKIKEIQAQAMAKVAVEAAKGNASDYKELVKLVSDVHKEAEKTGRKLSPELQALSDLLIGKTVQAQEQMMGGAQKAPQDQQQQGQPQQQQAK